MVALSKNKIELNQGVYILSSSGCCKCELIKYYSAIVGSLSATRLLGNRIVRCGKELLVLNNT